MQTLNVPDDLHHRLALRAAALGTTVEALAVPALERAAVGPTPPDHPVAAPAEPPALAGEAWQRAFDAWMAEVQARSDRYPPGHVVDVSREAMYEGCGE